MTLMGFLVLLFSLGALSWALMYQNSPMVFLSSTGALLPLIMVGLGHLQRSAFAQRPVSLQAASALCAGRNDGLVELKELEPKGGLFFRRHLILHGEIDLQGHRAYRYYNDLACGPSGGSMAITPPVSGLFKLQGRMEVRDILGLSRWSLMDDRSWEIPVVPWGLDRNYGLPAFQSENQDDQRPVKKQEQEKIFTREYMAGDLARDINWKSSVRIGKLITRIPPESLGQSPQMPLYFRSPPADRGYYSLFYLEQQKALLLGFLRTMMDQERSFLIYLNRKEYSLDSPEDLPGFERELAALGFTESYQDYPVPQGQQESCLFSSCLDQDLPRVLRGLDKEKVHLFLSQPPSVERPGETYHLIKEWPQFLPGRKFLKGHHPMELRLPRQLGELQQFSLEGRWL